jgi:hypothetical protein
MLSPISHQRGHVLLLAAAPRTARRRMLDPEAGTAALGSVPAELLLGSQVPADTVTLVDPREPQAVVGRLRTAAQTPGPLFVFLAGQLCADRRRGELHLALADTVPLSIRYSALAWEWIGRELQQRPPGTSTTVLVDLVAEDRAWSVLADDYQALQLPPGVELWGAVAPPPTRREPGVGTAYSRTLAELLRTGTGHSIAALHAMAAGQAHLQPEALLLAPYAPAPVPAAYPPAPAAAAPIPVPPPRPAAVPQPAAVEEPVYLLTPPTPAPSPVEPPRAPAAYPDPTPAVAEALQAGRFSEAGALVADWERYVLRAEGPQALQLADVAAVQAHIAVVAGQLDRGAERWIAAARQRLLWTAPDDPQVVEATNNAQFAWNRLTGPNAVILGTALVELQQKVGDAARLQAVERRLQLLRSAASAPQMRAQK